MKLTESTLGIKSKEYKLGNDVMRSNIGRYAVKKAEANKWLTQIGMCEVLRYFNASSAHIIP
jgi:hypothetical protein